jgi:murein L,D-transpeptidase YcbB/YkuD
MGSNDGGSGVKRVAVSMMLIFLAVTACKERHVKEGSKKEFESADYIDVEAFGAALQTSLRPADSAAATRIGDISNNLSCVYALTDNAPVWMNGKGISAAADSFIADLEDIAADGIDPEHYKLSALKAELGKLRGNKSPELNMLIAFDTAMTHTYLTAAKELLLGAVKIRKADSLWYNSNDSSWNASTLLGTELGLNDTYPSLNNFRSTLPTYNLLREECRRYMALQTDSALAAAQAVLREVKNTRELDSAQNASLIVTIKQILPWLSTSAADSLSETEQLVSAYQDYAHVKPTGKLDTSTLRKLTRPATEITGIIKANLERVRWLRKDMQESYIMVNVPLAEFFFRKDGAEIMHMKTVVGKPSRQTPALNADMANVVINPPWGVPPTILKKDVLPGMSKSGEAYLRRKGIQAFDKKGNRVDGSIINASNYKRYDYRQPPGDHNALGYVKFNLPNKWDIYLHDTPHREDFPNRYRAKSSGCIRLEKPKELALLILADIEKKQRYTMGRLDTMIRTHKTTWEVLKTKIPVHVVYLTAFESRDNAHIRLADDVYKRDGKLVALINELNRD